MAGNRNNNNSKDWIKIILTNKENDEITQFDMHIKQAGNNWDKIKKDAIVLLKRLNHIKDKLKENCIETSVADDKESLTVKLICEEMNGGRRRSRKVSRKAKRKTRRGRKH
jgi:hypothetical protein